ncbi:MAG: 1,4-alpha-glucan branching protein GlgB [Deltaproteobacteria bacterium]|nr:1,4-alpha-glucan branching protein GlgB [Deltaproteobacteria bacterium]
MSNASEIFSADELYLFSEGTYFRAYEKFGAHAAVRQGVAGSTFAVWAPNARSVSVVGDFNGWNRDTHSLRSCGDAGVWEGFIPGVGPGAVYKYCVRSHHHGYETLRADPFAAFSEVPPLTASRVWDLEPYEWNDGEWMRKRGKANAHDAPVSIYEVHLGSWRRKPEENARPLTYRELATELVAYCAEMEFTHVELLPVMEHPFSGSWGYQPLGFFSVTSRFGTPQDFMFLVDALHAAGIGVILDWVPGHFPTDEHGLGYFDGTHLYEHADPRQGLHQDWGTYVFNFGRPEVVSFLISSAHFWLEKYHIDGIRVDAVASILYLDYSRKEGEWVPNKFGGRENLEGIEFLKKLNISVYERYPDVMMCAEESTAWPMVSRPTYLGGLGFGYKWNMGWMNDVLSYFTKDPIHRAYHHHNLTFGLLYAFQENFILPFSHDEVVHGKRSMLDKMPGDPWQRFANLRALYGFMYGHPGKKLLFMGGEFGQWSEWNCDASLDWNLLDHSLHRGLKQWVRDLNRLLRNERGLHTLDVDWHGFSWIDCSDHLHSLLAFVRHGSNPMDDVVCVLNFTPVPRFNYRVGVPHSGYWEELLNSDSFFYGGSDLGNNGGVTAEPLPAHQYGQSISIVVPPLGVVFFRRMRGA